MYCVATTVPIPTCGYIYSCFADLSETEIMRWFDTADVLEFLHNVVAGKVL